MIFTIDIGGTFTKYAYISGDKIITKGRWQTTQDLSELLVKIGEVITTPPEYIGISSGGFWDNSGTSIGYETIKATGDSTFVKTLNKAYKCPVFIENDARCALLAEMEYGSLRNVENAVLFVLGSSLGCAVSIGGNILYGVNGQAGAMFMMPEFFNGTDYVFDESANSIYLTKAYEDCHKTGNMLMLEQKALAKDQKACQLIERYASAVALKCWYAYLMYDPAYIVLGGGIANSNYIVEKIKTYTKEFFKMDVSGRGARIIGAQFSEESNLMGAALLSKFKN